MRWPRWSERPIWILKNMSDKELSIIVVSYQSQRRLARCLDSIGKKIMPAVATEVVVVNNDPTENLEEISNKFPEVAVFNNQRNKGFGQACNLGAGYASGDVLLFLNPDTEIFSENITDVIGELKNNTASIIGSGLLTENEKIQKWSAGEEINLADILRNNLGFPRSRKIWKKSKRTPCAWVAGTAMFVKKELFQKLSGFDEKFFMYFEDVDLCRRARLLGHEVLYFPDFRVWHKSGESYENKRKQKKNYYRSQDYYFKKHRNSLEAVLLKFFRFIFS